MSDALTRRVAAAVIAACVAGLAGAVHAQADKPAAAVPVATPPPPRAQSTDALRLVDLWLEAQVAYERIPAVSAGVVIGQDLVWSKAYGQLDARRQVPAATDTIYSVFVSHGGTCPGYLSAVVLALKDEVAVIAMANANGAGTAPFARPIRQLVLKGLRLPVAPQGPGSPVLAAYAGRYASQPWSSEEVIVPWGNGLAQLDLPNTDPAGRMTVLRHVAGDRFREVRDDGSLGAEVAFERGSDGQVSGYTAWSQRDRRVEALPP